MGNIVNTTGDIQILITEAGKSKFPDGVRHAMRVSAQGKALALITAMRDAANQIRAVRTEGETFDDILNDPARRTTALGELRLASIVLDEMQDMGFTSPSRRNCRSLQSLIYRAFPETIPAPTPVHKPKREDLPGYSKP